MSALLRRLSYGHQIVVDVVHDDDYHPLLNTVRAGAVGKSFLFRISLIKTCQTSHQWTLCLMREGSDTWTTVTTSPSQSLSSFLAGQHSTLASVSSPDLSDLLEIRIFVGRRPDPW